MDPTTSRMFAGAAAATAPPVQITFTANTYNLAANQTSTLSWNVLNSASVSINYLGSVNASGSQNVTGSGETKTYVLSAVGLDGINYSSSVSISWGVYYGPVQISFTASRYTLPGGIYSTLSWSVTNSYAVNISNLGSVNASGSQNVTAQDTTITYTLTAYGQNGTTYYSSLSITYGPLCPWIASGVQSLIDSFC